MKYLVFIIHVLVLLMFARLLHLEDNKLYLILEILTAVSYILKYFSSIITENISTLIE